MSDFLEFDEIGRIVTDSSAEQSNDKKSTPNGFQRAFGTSFEKLKQGLSKAVKPMSPEAHAKMLENHNAMSKQATEASKKIKEENVKQNQQAKPEAKTEDKTKDTAENVRKETAQIQNKTKENPEQKKSTYNNPQAESTWRTRIREGKASHADLKFAYEQYLKGQYTPGPRTKQYFQEYFEPKNTVPSKAKITEPEGPINGAEAEARAEAELAANAKNFDDYSESDFINYLSKFGGFDDNYDAITKLYKDKYINPYLSAADKYRNLDYNTRYDTPENEAIYNGFWDQRKNRDYHKKLFKQNTSSQLSNAKAEYDTVKLQYQNGKASKEQMDAAAEKYKDAQKQLKKVQHLYNALWG